MEKENTVGNKSEELEKQTNGFRAFSFSDLFSKIFSFNILDADGVQLSRAYFSAWTRNSQEQAVDCSPRKEVTALLKATQVEAATGTVLGGLQLWVPGCPTVMSPT